MSRMLTQGATMLGEHCDGCGNPLFRVDDDVVCAVCSAKERDAGGDGGSTGDDGEDAADVEAAASVERSMAEEDAGISRGGGEAAEATAEVKENLSRVVQRLSREASDERDLSRLNQQLDALQKAVDLLERL